MNITNRELQNVQISRSHNERDLEHIATAAPSIHNIFYFEDSHQLARDREAVQGLTYQNKVNWSIFALPLLFLMVTVVLMAIVLFAHQTSIRQSEESKGVLEFLINNLKLNPINDVVEITKSPDIATLIAVLGHDAHRRHHIAREVHDKEKSYCPKGYEIGTLGSWAGVRSGCLCDDGSVHSRIYCTFHQGKNCKLVSEKSSVQLKHWKNQQICFKTQPSWNWVGSKKCTSGQKQCQAGICVASSDSCPLSSLEVDEQPDITKPDDYIYIDGTAYSKRRAITNQPIVGFSITAGITKAAPCYNSNIAPCFESTKFYPLANQPQSGCVVAKQIKAYVQQIDSGLINDLYKQNNLTSNLRDIPFYSDYIVPTDTLNLQTVQRIKISLDAGCDDFNSNDLTKLSLRSWQLDSLCNWVAILSIVLCSMGLLATMMLFVIRSRQLDACHVNQIQQTKTLYVISIMVAVLLIFLGCLYINHVDTSGGLKDLHEKFKRIILKQCFTEVPIQTAIKSVVHFSFDAYSTTGASVKTGLGIGIAFLLLAAILIAVQHFKFDETICVDPWSFSSESVQ